MGRDVSVIDFLKFCQKEHPPFCELSDKLDATFANLVPLAKNQFDQINLCFFIRYLDKKQVAAHGNCICVRNRDQQH